MSTGTIRWVTTLVGGAVVGMLAVAVASCSNDGPQTAEAGSPTSPAPATSAPPATTAPRVTTAAETPDAQADDEQPVGGARTITVTGQGRTTVKPDIAHVNMGVRVTGESAQAVLAEANEKAAALIAALKALGVADDDITTTGIGIHALYSQNGSTVTGFEATNDLGVTVRDIPRAGEIIDGAAAFAAEAITINGISFSVDEPEAVMAAARAAAIANAQKRAGEYADAAGVEVGGVLKISEMSVAPVGRMFDELAAADVAGSMPIQVGTTDLAATVTVVFELR